MSDDWLQAVLKQRQTVKRIKEQRSIWHDKAIEASNKFAELNAQYVEELGKLQTLTSNTDEVVTKWHSGAV